LITRGKYTGNICLVVGDDLCNDNMLKCDIIQQNNIIIKYFPNIQFSNEFIKSNDGIQCDGRNKTKKFQWHKLHLFNTFFKQWDYIFYLDCGMTIFSDILPLLNEISENTLLAHSDAYPSYAWKLHDQFDKTSVDYFTKLNATYNLDIDYFQTTIMLYDTKIINSDTYDNLLHLTHEYPISTTNEQGIIALYFTNIQPLYKQIKTNDDHTYFYDYLSREKNNRYIMLKSWSEPPETPSNPTRQLLAAKQRKAPQRTGGQLISHRLRKIPTLCS
jgi:hypothetical protein